MGKSSEHIAAKRGEQFDALCQSTTATMIMCV